MSPLRVSLPAVVALLCACSGSTSTPSAPSTPVIPQIGGTYSGPTTDTSIMPNVQVQTWTLQSARPGDLSARFRVCAGTLVVQQSGTALSGTYTQQDSCGGRTGQMSGTVRSNGTITLTLTGAGSDPLSWTGFANCTAAVSGTTDFAGTVNLTLLDASLPHNAVLSCPAEGNLTVNVRILGTR